MKQTGSKSTTFEKVQIRGTTFSAYDGAGALQGTGTVGKRLIFAVDPSKKMEDISFTHDETTDTITIDKSVFEKKVEGYQIRCPYARSLPRC